MSIRKKGTVFAVLLVSLFLPISQANAPMPFASPAASEANTVIGMPSTPAKHTLDGTIRDVLPNENADNAVKGIEIQLSAREMMEGHSTQSHARPLYKFDPVEIGLLEHEI